MKILRAFVDRIQILISLGIDVFGISVSLVPDDVLANPSLRGARKHIIDVVITFAFI